MGNAHQPSLLCTAWDGTGSSAHPHHFLGKRLVHDGHTEAQAILATHLPQNPGPPRARESLLPQLPSALKCRIVLLFERQV